MSGNGLPAIGSGERGDPGVGYVRVDETKDGRGHRLFPEIVIPERKRRTYDLCRALFDDYRLDQTKAEETTRAEARDILALLEAVTDTPVMRLAHDLVAERTGESYDRDGWMEVLFDVWFRPFEMGRNLDLSGFEHVVVGEQRQATVGGQHFWYSYALQDGALPEGADRIAFLGYRYGRGRDGTGRALPFVATLSYRWDAWDAFGAADRPLVQEIGGFFVGCSIEGLMALGTVRFMGGPQEAVLEGARFDLKTYDSPDGRSLRTFYPVLLRPA